MHPPSIRSFSLAAPRGALVRLVCGTQRDSVYRCSLPGLTGFTGFCRAGPGQLSLGQTKTGDEPREGVQPR